MNFLAAALAPFVALGMYVGGLFAPEPQLGASEAVPVTIAFFETTLQDAISSSATSFTLTSATDKDGTTLASSTYAFVIDEGSANEEIVIADCTATACTNALRGVSARTGNTEVTALKKAHRRGASIKITDAPILPLLSRIMRGEAGVDFTPDENTDLVTKTYVDSLALGTTTVSASLTDDGIVELATGLQAASSTATDDSGSPLVLHTGISTSTGGVANTVPVTGASGTLDDAFITFASTTAAKIGDTPLMSIGKNYYATTSLGTGSWSVPSGVTKVKVTVTGGGGAGGSCSVSNGQAAGGGGGAGGTAIAWYDVSATTSVQIVVGAAAATSSFAGTIIGQGGSAGVDEGAGGAGGAATGGNLNLYGGSGGGGQGQKSTSVGGNSGIGGSSYWGGGGKGVSTDGTAGGAAYVYGAGGGGGYCDNSGSSSAGGGAGKSGIVLIEY